MAVESAAVALLPGLALEAPASALYVRSVDYEVYLPARSLSERPWKGAAPTPDAA